MQATQPLTHIRVGNQGDVEAVAAVRTPAQREAVRKITVQEGFDFCCGNPFTADVGKYTGPFAFVYYTKRGDLHNAYIGKRGNIIREMTVTAERGEELAVEAKLQYEQRQAELGR